MWYRSKVLLWFTFIGTPLQEHKMLSPSRSCTTLSPPLSADTSFSTRWPVTFFTKLTPYNKELQRLQLIASYVRYHNLWGTGMMTMSGSYKSCNYVIITAALLNNSQAWGASPSARCFNSLILVWLLYRVCMPVWFPEFRPFLVYRCIPIYRALFTNII